MTLAEHRNNTLALMLLLSGFAVSGCSLADSNSGSINNSMTESIKQQHPASSHQHSGSHDIASMANPSRPQQVAAMGLIKAIDSASRKIKVMHQPIDVWGMGAMQMTFQLAPEVDISSLTRGMDIHFMVQTPSVGKYLITEIMPH